jgi:type II secretory pathway pseudopilin PulG
MGRLHLHQRTFRAARHLAGYTIAELVVVTAIIGILTTVVVINQSSFSRTIILKSTVADIALTLRNAQVFGVSSRSAKDSSNNYVNNAPYGVDFSSATPSAYTFFADTDPSAATKGGVNQTPATKSGDGYYCPTGAGGACGTGVDSGAQTYSLNNGMTIKNVCVLTTDTGNPNYCWNSGANNTLKHLSIQFTRPNPTASFYATDNNNARITGATFVSACVVVESPQGTTRSLAVNSLGQITLLGATDPCP